MGFLLADALNNEWVTIFTCGGVQSNHCRATAVAKTAWLGLLPVVCFLEALNRSATYCIFSCNVQNEHLFTSVTLTWCPCCLSLSTLAHIYIAMGIRKTLLEQGFRTNNKSNVMYAFTSTVFKPGIHSSCWKVPAAVTLPSAISPPLFCHWIRR